MILAKWLVNDEQIVQLYTMQDFMYNQGYN